MLDKVYILVLIEIQNNSGLNMISLFHITFLSISPGLFWWLHSHQESRHRPSYCFNTSGCYSYLHGPCHYVQIPASSWGKENRDMTYPFPVRCIHHICSHLIGFTLITWPYLAIGEAWKIYSLF